MSDDDRLAEGEKLEERLSEILSSRSIIVGIGNRQCGDDGFGPAVIEALKGKVSNHLIDAGVAPENYTHLIAKYHPDMVLFVDAAEFGADTGELALHEAENLVGGGISSHCGNISMIAQYISLASNAKCLFLLVQPSHVRYAPEKTVRDANHNSVNTSTDLSPPVQNAVKRACRMILHVLNR